MPSDDSTYLGDGLFVDFDGYYVELYASNGVRSTNTVFLDPSVLNAFLSYVKQKGLTNRVN